jgi:hypothetical protein
LAQPAAIDRNNVQVIRRDAALNPQAGRRRSIAAVCGPPPREERAFAGTSARPLDSLENAMADTAPQGVNAPNAPAAIMRHPASAGSGALSGSGLIDPDHGAPKPATNVHSGAVAAALAAYAWFIMIAWIAFGRGYAALDLVVVVLISVVLLGLLAGGAMMSRNMTPDRETTRTFAQFVNGRVDIETGRVSGRDALVQIVVMPILLAIGGTVIAAVWIIVSH